VSRLKKILKIIYLFTVLFLVLCFGAANFAFGQSGGFKYFKNYSKSDYERDAQNWGIAQSAEGFIYVATQDGLLEYDGVSWRVIYIPDYSNYSIRSIAIDENGTIYVGGNSEIGFFTRQPDSSMKYTSLVKYITEKNRAFSNIFKTQSTKEGIYFRNKDFLFHWNPNSKQMWEWKQEESFSASFVINGQYFIHNRKIGLMSVTGDSLKLVPGGQAFASKKIYMMIPFSEGSQKLLVGTKEEGLFIYDGQALTSFPTEADEYLKEKTIYSGIRLESTPGEFAIATLLGGVVIIDSNGKVKHIYDKQSGLPDDGVNYVYEDFQGNVWLALANGISKIEYASPFLIYDARSGLQGFVLSVTKHNGVLCAGTNKGLYFRDSSSQWLPVEGITGNCHSLLSTGSLLLAAATSGVFEINNKNIVIRKMIEDSSFILSRSRKDNNRVWVGTRNGLVSLSLENNRWAPGPSFENIKQEIHTIVENHDGNLWLGTVSQGAIKVDFPVNGSIENPSITSFLKSNGLPEGEIRVYEAANHIIFGTENGIFRFDEKTKTFIPDDTLGKEYAGGGEKNVFRLAQDIDRSIWFHSGNKNFHAIPKPDNDSVKSCRAVAQTPLAR
jgi:ligand-binding sensor domain-containing protein